MNIDSVVRGLLDSDVPAIRYKIRVGYLGEDPTSRSIRFLREEIRESTLVTSLLRRRRSDGTIPGRVYAKWQGAHWIMATLADIGYPCGDQRLLPVRDQLQQQWLGEQYYQEFEARTRANAYSRAGVPRMEGRHRRCASQQSNALWSILKLGLADDRTHAFVERLLHWQWPDGGWNCDKEPKACHSSFMESILPLRALAYYGESHANGPAQKAAERAAEVFLKRHLFLRERDDAVMRKDFVELHYPLYWHYDILHGLKVMAEAGFIHDARCRPALDLLLRKRLPDGGWPAEKKYYKASDAVKLGNDFIDWGGTSTKKSNPWVTADALYVLRTAGCID